jgi:predicted lipoprotein with Yx(FWY)xxD motif
MATIKQTGQVRTRWAAIALSLGLLGSCAQETVPPPSEGTHSASPTAAPADRRSAEPSVSTSAGQDEPGTRVVAALSDFGTVLFGATGQAIYIFDVETTATPRCYDGCADAWPPVLTQAAPQAAQGVTGSLLGTTARAEGTTQVTYGGHPLYFYAHEGKHEVKCHDVFLNGGKWYAIQPDGNRAP